MSHKYILDAEGTPIPCEDIQEWARWFEDSVDKRRVAWDEVQVDDHTVIVSSVFLGLDHNYFDDGPPVLYETMAFLKDESPEAKSALGASLGQYRFATRDECLAFHQAVLKLAEERLKNISQVLFSIRKLLESS